MLAWRNAKRAYALDRIGAGSHIAGGRWNSEGVSAIYADMAPRLRP
jgi:RES domain-containing protein